MTKQTYYRYKQANIDKQAFFIPGAVVGAGAGGLSGYTLGDWGARHLGLAKDGWGARALRWGGAALGTAAGAAAGFFTGPGAAAAAGAINTAAAAADAAQAVGLDKAKYKDEVEPTTEQTTETTQQTKPLVQQ